VRTWVSDPSGCSNPAPEHLRLVGLDRGQRVGRIKACGKRAPPRLDDRRSQSCRGSGWELRPEYAAGEQTLPTLLQLPSAPQQVRLRSDSRPLRRHGSASISLSTLSTLPNFPASEPLPRPSVSTTAADPPRHRGQTHGLRVELVPGHTDPQRQAGGSAGSATGGGEGPPRVAGPDRGSGAAGCRRLPAVRARPRGTGRPARRRPGPGDRLGPGGRGRPARDRRLPEAARAKRPGARRRRGRGRARSARQARQARVPGSRPPGCGTRSSTTRTSSGCSETSTSSPTSPASRTW
jgi:hypothetical protein